MRMFSIGFSTPKTERMVKRLTRKDFESESISEVDIRTGPVGDGDDGEFAVVPFQERLCREVTDTTAHEHVGRPVPVFVNPGSSG